MLAFFWGAFLLWRNIRLTSFKEEVIFDGLFWGLFGGLFFSRLVYFIFNFQDFGFNLLKFILINGYPGLSLWGFVLGFLIVIYLYFSFQKIRFFEVVDYFVPSFFLSLFFGKLGSFFSGQEVGIKTQFFLKVRYFGFDGFRHLVSLYEALFYFLGFYLSTLILFEIRKERFFKGFLFHFGLWYFSLVSFLASFLKEENIFIMKKSLNLVVSLIFLLTTTAYFVYYFRDNWLNILKKYGKGIFRAIYSKTKRKAS